MGWKSLKSTATSIKEFYSEKIKNSVELKGISILDAAFYNNCGFLLIEHPKDPSIEYDNWMKEFGLTSPFFGKKEIFIIHTQNKKDPNTDKNERVWIYKISRENEDVNYLTCPKRMLDQSENDIESACSWRSKCYQKHRSKNKHRNALRSKQKLIESLTKGLVIETEMYGSIIFEKCFKGEKNVIIGYLSKSPINRLQFQIALISENELKSALLKIKQN